MPFDREFAIVLVRTDSRSFTRETTQALLTELWPEHAQSSRSEQPARSQTSLFGHQTSKPSETDFLLMPKNVSTGFVSQALAPAD